MRRIPSAFFPAAALLLFLWMSWTVLTPSPAAAASSQVNVSIRNFAFSPATTTIAGGTRVVWTNGDSVNHTVTSDSGVWNSGLLGPGQSFGFTFDQVGEFRYHCTIHQFMQGTIVVSRLGAPAPITPPDNARLTTLGTTLHWDQPQGTAQYQIQILPAPNPFTGQPDGPAIDLVIGDPTMVQSASYQAPEPVFGQGPYILLPDMTYRWRVRVTHLATSVAQDDPSWSDWSPDSTFHTRAAGSAGITAAAPPMGGPAARRATVAWNDSDSGVFYYEVQLSADAQFRTGPDATAPVYWNLLHGGQSSPPRSWTVPPGFDLAPGQYFWRVRPRVQGDGQPVAWSSAFNFRVP